MEKTRKHRGTGRAMLQEVADFAGVRTTTVSRALGASEQISDKLREKIKQAVEELGYILNRTAGALAPSHNDIVAVLVPSLTDKTNSCFMQSLQQVLNRNELQLLLGCHEYSRLKEAEILMTLLQGNLTTLVIFGSQLADKAHQILGKTNILTTNVADSPFGSTQITIETVFFEVLHELTEHLLGQGYKSIGFIGAHMDNRLQRQ